MNLLFQKGKLIYWRQTLLRLSHYYWEEKEGFCFIKPHAKTNSRVPKMKKAFYSRFEEQRYKTHVVCFRKVSSWQRLHIAYHRPTFLYHSHAVLKKKEATCEIMLLTFSDRSHKLKNSWIEAQLARYIISLEQYEEDTEVPCFTINSV